MATKADFTEQEWKDLSEGPTGLVLWVSSIDPGFLARVKESWAASQAVVKGATTELERELAKPAKPDFATGSLEQQRDGVIGALTRGIATLQAKAPDEVEPFKAWIDGIADATAEAAGGVSAAEGEAIAAVKAALAGAAPTGPTPA